jgi:microcystin-dependent protein
MITGIGGILAYGGTTAPAGTLICDGSAVSRTTYTGLFAVIGTRFGAGDGTTTFNLPSLSGAVTYIIIYVDDTTGTGATVLSHSPVLGSPTLGAASATSLAFSSATGLIGAVGTNAPAGSVGEYVVSNLPSTSAITLASQTAANVTSISLGAGDWDVRGVVDFLFPINTMTTMAVSAISLISASLPAVPDDTQPQTIMHWGSFIPGNGTISLPTVTGRLSLAMGTTVYLVAYCNFGSALKACGSLSARRMR